MRQINCYNLISDFWKKGVPFSITALTLDTQVPLLSRNVPFLQLMATFEQNLLIASELEVSELSTWPAPLSITL